MSKSKTGIPINEKVGHVGDASVDGLGYRQEMNINKIYIFPVKENKFILFHEYVDVHRIEDYVNSVNLGWSIASSSVIA